MRKYNANLKGMVDNYREKIAKASYTSEVEPYTDEQLYDVIDAWVGCSTPKEQLEAVIDDIKAGVIY